MLCKKVNKQLVELVDNCTYELENAYDIDETFSYVQIPENLDASCVKAILVDNVICLVEDLELKKLNLVSQAKSRLDNDVNELQFQYFGTYTQTSAIRTSLTALDMLQNPSAYVCDIFADEQAVIAFANSKLAPARQCALAIMRRIAAFETEKNSILE